MHLQLLSYINLLILTIKYKRNISSNTQKPMMAMLQERVLIRVKPINYTNLKFLNIL